MTSNIITFFFIVVAIPVICSIGFASFGKWLKHKEKMGQLLATETAEKAAQYAAQTERLEQRVRVLERIVTDRGVDLATEIDSLRDQPLN